MENKASHATNIPDKSQLRTRPYKFTTSRPLFVGHLAQKNRVGGSPIEFIAKITLVYENSTADYSKNHSCENLTMATNEQNGVRYIRQQGKARSRYKSRFLICKRPDVMIIYSLNYCRYNSIVIKHIFESSFCTVSGNRLQATNTRRRKTSRSSYSFTKTSGGLRATNNCNIEQTQTRRSRSSQLWSNNVQQDYTNRVLRLTTRFLQVKF